MLPHHVGPICPQNIPQGVDTQPRIHTHQAWWHTNRRQQGQAAYRAYTVQYTTSYSPKGEHAFTRLTACLRVCNSNQQQDRNLPPAVTHRIKSYVPYITGVPRVGQQRAWVAVKACAERARSVCDSTHVWATLLQDVPAASTTHTCRQRHRLRKHRKAHACVQR